MSTHAIGSHHATPARAGFGDLLTLLVIRIERMMATRRERRALLAASDEMLRDLGLSRADVYQEGTRSFWDVPSR